MRQVTEADERLYRTLEVALCALDQDIKDISPLRCPHCDNVLAPPTEDFRAPNTHEPLARGDRAWYGLMDTCDHCKKTWPMNYWSRLPVFVERNIAKDLIAQLDDYYSASGQYVCPETGGPEAFWNRHSLL